MQMIQLGYKLARLTRVKEYREKAGQVWAWVRKVGILDNLTAQVMIKFGKCFTDLIILCSGL